jgi:tetratricopeptide (TPR) repeat protein
MDLRRKLGVEETPEYAVSLIQVAEIRLYQKDARTAEPRLRQALEIRRKRLSAGHPDIATAEVRLGEALLAEKEPQQAEPVLKQAVDAVTHAPFRLPAWQVAEAEAAYGVCLQDLGRTGEGARLLEESRAALAWDPRPAFRADPTARLRRLGSTIWPARR